MSTLAHLPARAQHGTPCHRDGGLDRSVSRTSRARLRLGHAHSSLAILFSNARRVRVRSWVAPSRCTEARRSRRVRHDNEIPTRRHCSIEFSRPSRRSFEITTSTGRGPKTRCWPLLVSRRDERCDPGCGRPKAAPRHPPRLNTVSVLHRHTRPLRTPIIDHGLPGVAFSALRSPAVRDPCAIRARSCAQLEILMASSGQ